MGRPRKRRLVSEEDKGSASEPVVATAERPVDEDNDNDGDWFEGRGIFSPLMPNVRSQPWPALDDVPAACRMHPEHPPSVPPTTAVPELTESCDSASSTNGSGATSQSMTSTPAADFSMPSPAESATPTTCACLSSMYLSLSTLQTMNDFTFPGSLHKLRQSISCAWNVLHCPLCPLTYLTGFQNVQLLGMFTVSVAERYSKVLAAIDKEAEDAIAEGRTKSFRMGDLQMGTSHLHSSDPKLCMAHMCLDLDPRQWRQLVRRVVKGEIMGTAQHCCPSFMTLIDGMITRQENWHKIGPPADYPRPFTEEELEMIKNPKTMKGCLTMVFEAKKIIEHMTFD
ncbi:hypothetical protein BDZ85DRAFT_281988 [Elsinoe ampelina]|uniref:Uncharacterized protein n=1 Tax=Elsinoe ampelina TaxID=302913 RepID=A0A6A6GBG1_9PEZI|nr:hypothetical protein BDZ85DRAFT_281988 [Elsinoe ampelina]